VYRINWLVFIMEAVFSVKLEVNSTFELDKRQSSSN
jgi:hypothetical protein